MTPRQEAKRAIQLKKQRDFLVKYLEVATIFHAAAAVGITRKTHYDWLDHDPEYATAFADARECATDVLEKEARRRAVDGVDEPVYQGRRLVGHIRKYSDTLLIFLMKGARPDIYRERVSHEHAGVPGKPIVVTWEGENGDR